MKLIDAVRNVDKSESNRNWFDRYNVGQAFGLNFCWDEFPDDFDVRLTGYHIQVWRCTDTSVGLTAVYFDDEPVATIWQPFRKSDPKWKFISVEAAAKVRTWLVSKFNTALIKVDDFNMEIGDTYQVAYAEQLMDNCGFYKGVPVTVTPGSRQSSTETIEVSDVHGVKQRIHIRDLAVPFRLAKQSD